MKFNVGDVVDYVGPDKDLWNFCGTIQKDNSRFKFAEPTYVVTISCGTCASYSLNSNVRFKEDELCYKYGKEK